MIALVSLLLSTGTNYAADTNATAVSKPNSTVATAKSVQILVDENQRLLKEVDFLNNEVEELKGTIAYNQLMDKTLDRLVEAAMEEERLDEAALQAYENTMSTILNQLEAQQEAERAADAAAIKNYHQLMASTLLRMVN